MAMYNDMGSKGAHYDASAPFDFSYDADSGISESPLQAHPATVSPHDLVNDFDAAFSAPSHLAFPTIPTPSSEYFNSPDLSSSVEMTPLFDDLEYTDYNNLPTLFPELQTGHFESQPAIAPNNSFGSLSELNHVGNVSAQASPMVRQKSSPGRPPICHDRKASLSAGITKANQKNRKDLPDIVVESEDDKDTAKRKKNTAAARKSRQRKLDQMSAMSAEITRLREMVTILGGDPDCDI